MIATTGAFDTAVVANPRKPKCKIDVLWTDPYVQSGIVVSSSDVNHTSWEDPQVVDLGETPAHKYFILDGTTVLDGTYYLAPSTISEANENQMGWYSETVADGSGDFSPYPELTITFPARAINSLLVVGDSVLDQYPVDFDVYVYEGAVEALHEVVTGNAIVRYTKDVSDEGITSATSMKLVIKKWSDSDTISKILEFFETLTTTFYDDDIVSINILEEREIRDASLPVGNISSNELDLELQNINMTLSGSDIENPLFPDNANSPLHNLVKPNRRITAYLGFDGAEYIQVGVFWTGDWSVKDDSFSVTVPARDRLDLLRRAEFRCDELFENTTLYALAEYVLEHARDYIPLIDMTWDIDEELQNYTVPYAWFEKTNYMAALRDIAEAAMGQVYMSKDDVVIVESYLANHPDASDLTITKSQYFTRQQPSNTDDLSNYIEVETQPLLPADEESDILLTDEIEIGASETLSDLEFHFTRAPATVLEEDITFEEETGGVSLSLSDVTIYPWGMIVTITEGSGNAGTFKLKAIGIEYSVRGSETVVSQDAESIKENGKRTYKFNNNHLVQTRVLALTISSTLLSTYKDERKDITLNWIGNPALELGDTITAPVYVPDSLTDIFVVYKQRLSFDGALHCVTYGRRVSLPTTTTTTEAPTTTTTTSGA